MDNETNTTSRISKCTFIKILGFCFVLFPIFTSCSGHSLLEIAMKEAGSNRIELEKVLNHYSRKTSDSLKYRAALFLIENMRFHYSQTGLNIDNYYKQITPFIHKADIITLEDVKNKLSVITTETLNRNIILSKDIETISSDFLISHIDAAFLTREYPWNKDIEFKDFCEYVLPYRIKNEPIENWIPIYTDFSKHIADSLYKESNSYKDFIVQLHKFFNEKTHYVNLYNFRIKNIPSSLIGIRYGTCEEIAMLGIYIFRSLGIPVYFDFTPNWANRSLGHDWIGIDINGEYYPFILQDHAEFGNHLSDRTYEKFGKIYRNTYSIQNESLLMQIKNHKEKIPSFFTNPHIKDVSYLYKNITSNARLKLSYKGNSRIAYLSIFNNKEWIPISWSKIKNNEVSFQNIQKECCYLITMYEKDELLPLLYPFIIDEEGHLKHFIPNKDSLQKITLGRKYPPFAIERYANRSVGGEFHGSNRKDFVNYQLLYTVKHTLTDMKWHTVPVVPKGKFKYLRYYSAKGGYNNIAELKFFSVEGNLIHGNIIAEGEFLNSKASLKENAFDGDPLTFFAAKDPDDSWVGLELEKEQLIEKIVYLFRNDDNNIRKGDKYEFFYWDNAWVSLGIKEGIADSLNFTGCPTNALFLLRNHTRGQEERIFTYNQEKQIWW